MRYQFRCPLCLKKLGAGHSLIAFKIEESTSGNPPLSLEVDCGQEDFFEEIIRFGGNSIYTPTTEDAVYLSHLQCDAVNPFWEEATEPPEDGQPGSVSKVSIPGRSADGRKITWPFMDEKTGTALQKEMQHQIVEMLRCTIQFSERHRPMWFPFGLLRSTATVEGENLRRPFGSLVEMASAPGVGKTILTLQLLNKKLYAGHRDRGIEIADYFFTRREVQQDGVQPKDAFMRELFFHSSWGDRPEFRPPATTDLTPGDLRAIFIRPAGESHPATAPPPTGAQLLKKEGRLLGRVWRNGVNFFRYFWTETRDAPETEPKINLTRELGKADYWHSILFYDTAGETQKNFGEVTRAVRRLTNKLAICIDAQEIFVKDGENLSISQACERIRTMIQQRDRKSCCLIITKLDLISQYESEKENMRKVADDLQVNDGEARRMLVKWLEDNADADKDYLRQYLLEYDSHIEQVFFVWTEGLPKMAGIRSYPIASFEPRHGEAGTEVTIHAASGYDFKEAKSISFNGKEANFTAESGDVIKAKIPEGATTGFIEIRLEAGTKKDEGTSEQYFVVGQQYRYVQFSRPQSHGLIKFLAWCLDRPPRELIKELKSGGPAVVDSNRNGEM